MPSWLSKIVHLGTAFAKDGEWVEIVSPRSATGILMRRATADGYETREPTEKEVTEFLADDAW